MALEVSVQRLKTFDGHVKLEQATSKGHVPVSVLANVLAEKNCDRCGARTEVILKLDEAWTFVPAASLGPSEEEEVELERTDLDVSFYEDGKIDLEHLIAESLTLGLPSRILCTDTNGCDTRAAVLLQAPDEGGHPAFAALAAFAQKDDL